MGACGSSGPGKPDGGGNAGATGSAGNTGAAGSVVTIGTQCGFTMPNPASAGLPNPASYTMNTDGTVSDAVTGLTWEGAVDPGEYTQANAAAYCAGKGAGWRLPSRLKLVSLVDYTIAYPGPTIDATSFPNTPAVRFWTSSLDAGVPGNGWAVNFNNGDTSSESVGAASAFRVRCTNAPAPTCDLARYEVTPDTSPSPLPAPPPGVFYPGGLVHDKATGLTWQQKSTQVLPFSRAMTYCAALGTGWRLPSLTELQTIVDDRNANPAIDGAAFPNAQSDSFWSSQLAGPSGFAWFVDFREGSSDHSFVVANYDVRCVR
jgi:hypothetical protein